ncbi:MAG: MFS transporter [Acidobacteria bacterium]|nr:MFS transporter [Acidobacteriota bacterium]
MDSSNTAGSEARHEPPVGYLELLRRNRDFRLLWLGQVVSQLGDWFNTIALYTLVLEVTGGSGRAIGLVLVTRFLPMVFLGPFAGVVADRFNRRTVMIVSDLARALVVLGFLFIRRPEHLWMVYALSAVQLSLSTFFEPARSAALPSVVSDRELMTANTISSVTWSAMLTLGAAIGGLITSWFGTRAAFVLDSVSYLASAALIASLRLPRRPQREKRKLTLARALGLTDTLEGLRYVRTRPHVKALMLVKPAWGVGGGVLTLLTVFGDKIFTVGGRAASGIGILLAARGVGTAIGPLVTRRLAGETRGQMQKGIGISFIIAGVFYAAFAVSTNFPLALLMLVLAHMGASMLWVSSTVLLQTAVEDAFRGRVFAAEMMLLTLALAASNYATGEALDRFRVSPRAITFAFGIFFMLPGVVWLLTGRWWDRETNERG